MAISVNPQHSEVDILVIGGGINGVGIARDAAGRGFSVSLCEANDLASGTSSASSKLIHGGLWYLEHYEFRLVREALKERETLLRMAPHITRPMRFVLPHLDGIRPMWLLRLGLFLYDHLGKRKLLPGTRSLKLNDDVAGKSLKPAYTKALEYSDCWVDDARMVVLNAMDAANRGAEINVHTRVVKAESQDGIWQVTAVNRTSGETIQRQAKVVVNAAGPWVDEVLSEALGFGMAKNVRLVRGSHIVVNKLFDHDRSYIFQNRDGRIIFAIPYQDDYTLIGTTDQEHGEKVGKVEITPEELRYLCDSASEYFSQVITVSDVVWSYSGVRPLYADGASEAQEATRDYVIEAQEIKGAPLINIFGGKITTYRRLSESILTKVESFLGKRGASWTASSHLPGGEFDVGDHEALIAKIHRRYPFVSRKIVTRYVKSYGTLTYKLLAEVSKEAEMGQHFGAGLYQVEVDYLLAHEWATDAQDVLFRRTKLGICMPSDSVAELAAYICSVSCAVKQPVAAVSA